MKKKGFSQKIPETVGILCIPVSVALYVLGMIFGGNLLFVLGVAVAVAGIVIGKKTDVSYVMVLCIIITIAVGLELFMRVRDGYTGSGWYYLHLLQHPEDNVWNR